jgi:hypothetical protein
MTNGDSSKQLRRARRKDGNPGSGRRRKGTWKKLLWVKQSCELFILTEMTTTADVW